MSLFLLGRREIREGALEIVLLKLACSWVSLAVVVEMHDSLAASRERISRALNLGRVGRIRLIPSGRARKLYL